MLGLKHTTIEKKKRVASEKTKPLADGSSLATGTSAKGCHAVTHTERISRLSECKKRSRQMGQYLNELKHCENLENSKQIAKLAVRVKGCANYLVFHNYYTVDQIRLAKVTTCQIPTLCPFCARSKAAKMLQKYLERFEKITSENPNLKPALLTLTVKNGKELRERFEHLYSSWRIYQNRRRQYFKQGRGFNELCKVEGAVFSYEITKQKKGWHPHLHAVVLLDDWMNQKELSNEWKKITGDSDIADIRKLKGNNQEQIIKSFLEVFKYTLKFSELSLEDNFFAYEELKGKRLQGSFGSFWGVKIPESDTDDLFENLPYLEMFYKFINGKGYNLENIQSICEKHSENVSDVYKTAEV